MNPTLPFRPPLPKGLRFALATSLVLSLLVGFFAAAEATNLARLDEVSQTFR